MTQPTPLTDDAARAEIREQLGESLFVDAGAGTGKTSALVDRVVNSVLRDGVPLAKTAVVTFTEKAGTELRDRLRAAFERAHRGAADAGTVDAGAADLARAHRARQALDDLDGAPIGTLHSFAQRILAAFPIQAGMPPLVEVLDEVGSSVAFDDRWSTMWRRLLDDDELVEPLELALEAGVKPDQLRSLARAFGSDWDLIEAHVLAEPTRGVVLPDTDALLRQAVLLSEAAADCRNDDDLFLVHVVHPVTAWVESMRRAVDDRERFTAVRALAALKTGKGGRGANWTDLPTLKADAKALTTEAVEITARYADAALRPLARWIAQAVLDGARERVASGSLEFHDLLVASRDLLRRDPEARAQLQAAYPRLLLDEFQDTDPIQIELAVRIAGGREADAPDWRDVAVPAGSLFVVGDPKQSIYRFRRANIATYLEAGGWFGRRVSLVTNFRTVPPVIDWVNAVFGQVIVEQPGLQPAYEALAPHRAAESHGGALIGPPVTVLGADPHPPKTTVGPQREAEASEVAAVITAALDEGWTVFDERAERWRPITARDIAVLIPARSSLPMLEDALDAAGIPYRAESSSLVYQSIEVRSLMAAARAIADPSDQLSTVTALRSAIFGCGDDDLFAYRRDGGSFTVGAPVPDELADTPAGASMAYLGDLARRSRWMSPADLLTTLAVDRRVLEAASVTERPSRVRDHWGRVRFVIDQARAWSEVEHGGLREYLAWAAHQALDSARVAESLLPETDLDVVRIMTVHAAKGLEFGMVVLSGMTSHPRRSNGVRLLWKDRGYAVKLSGPIETNDFADAAPLDEQMDDEERRRLIYVAATRARDHLVVSLHRAERPSIATPAEILVAAGALEVPGVVRFSGVAGAAASGPSGLGSGRGGARAGAAAPAGLAPAPSYEAWASETDAARQRSRRPSAQSASGLEGTEPEVVWAVLDALDSSDPDAAAVAAGTAKGARDVELAPWLKGRYGNLIGRAVHGTLQAVAGSADLVDTVAVAQALAEGIPNLGPVVAAYVRSALATDVVRRAFASEHWSELYVGADQGDGTVLEGFIDLLFRDADGSLVIVDYKTDAVTDAAALADRSRHYAPQLDAYVRALHAATGETARAELVFLDAGGGAGKGVRVGVPA
ncbi:ATP-dependent exoDNAse (exonuclease V) beta subunit [Agromyces terreus]|uniref:DNA 3'-5' helicase n=1 Tax=Agromyces terreus TaxID=424795 RepID=A0A9X2GYD0_9MICO|nr:UvrD-helicase domain-containing protein [Agromyces terreus]MCP2370897.1 ATP-dependent exoDNAse (exonuclease V) beta subunit [Agromyces terreus]